MAAEQDLCRLLARLALITPRRAVSDWLFLAVARAVHVELKPFGDVV